MKLQPLMIAGTRRPAARWTTRCSMDRSATWDTTMRADKPEPRSSQPGRAEAVRAMYADDLGQAFDRYFDTRATALIRLLKARAGPRLVRRTHHARTGAFQAMLAASSRSPGWPTSRCVTSKDHWQHGAGGLRTMPLANTVVQPAVPWLAKYFSVEVPRPRARPTVAAARWRARWISTRMYHRLAEPATREALAPLRLRRGASKRCRSTSTPPAGAGATRCRPTTARLRTAGPGSTTWRSRPSAKKLPRRRRAAPGSLRQSRTRRLPRARPHSRARLPETWPGQD